MRPLDPQPGGQLVQVILAAEVVVDGREPSVVAPLSWYELHFVNSSCGSFLVEGGVGIDGQQLVEGRCQLAADYLVVHDPDLLEHHLRQELGWLAVEHEALPALGVSQQAFSNVNQPLGIGFLGRDGQILSHILQRE